MYDRRRLAALLDQRRPGYTLPQPFYTDPDILDFDIDTIFSRNWILVGFEAELERPGSYLASTIGRTPVLILRNEEGRIVGLHNSCRHRGAQICATGSGRVARLVCPYHQWSYNLNGKLLNARGAPADFVPAAHGLLPIRVEIVAGCIYASLSDAAPPFAPFRAALQPALEPYNLHNLKVAHVVVLHENANWKLVMENARECHHCSARHPEFMSVVPRELVESGDPFPEGEEATPFMRKMRELGFETEGFLADWWQLGRIRLREGHSSFSADGKPLVKKLLTDANDGYLGTFRWATEAGNFCHVTSDSVFMFSVNPTGTLTTDVTVKWLVHKDAVEGVDYTVNRLIELWDKTNRQDQDLAENNQRGVNGRGYVPGPYSPQGEPYILRWMDWYCAEGRAYLKTEPVAAAI